MNSPKERDANINSMGYVLSTILLFISLVSIAQPTTPRIDSLKNELHKVESDSLRLRLLLNLSTEYQYLDFDQSKTLADEATALSEKLNLNWAKLRAYKQQSNLSTIRGDFLTALKFDKARLPLAIALRDSTNIADTNNLLGDDYINVGEYDEAYFYFTQSFRISRAIKDTLQTAIALHNVGAVFKELGQYDIALDHIELARKLGEKINDKDGLAYTFYEMGDIYLRNNKYDDAKETLLKALSITRERDIDILEPNIISRIARLYLRKGEFDKAYQYYDSSEMLHSKTKNEYGLAESSLGKGRVALKQGKFDDATNQILESLNIAKRINARTLEVECYRALSQLYEVRGDYKSALDYTKQSKALQDSLFNQDMTQKIFQDQLRFQTESKDLQIAALSETQAKQADELDRQSFLKNILVVVVALTVILLFSVYRSGQRRIRINKLLIEHQNEIKKRSLELEQLNQVKDKFFSVISHDLRSPINALAGILNLMAKGQITSEELPKVIKELQLQFNHTKNLINNLLDWALLQMDKLRIQPVKIDLRSMVDDNFELLNSLHIKEVKLINSIPEDTAAYADLNMINLVFRNLILNGMKFTEEGGEITIGAKVQDEELMVWVKDNGVGISPEIQKILFEKTSGYSTRGTANEKGTGLGLILCKEFVERNGGRIWLESEEGKGSTFYFTVSKFKEPVFA
ncbi:MAG: tetratricopeptide repeat-containing sensor histidine kinase [Cyclobacteriaceae bacterium]|nr:tetratricopeptide repeat-containing sensor histidine kinase [Cyclobacteriaceae bacterium]